MQFLPFVRRSSASVQNVVSSDVLTPAKTTSTYFYQSKKLGGGVVWLAFVIVLVFSFGFSQKMKAQDVFCELENEPCVGTWAPFNELVDIVLPAVGGGSPCTLSVRIYYWRRCNSIKILDADYSWTSNPPPCYDPAAYSKNLSEYILNGAINPLLTQIFKREHTDESLVRCPSTTIVYSTAFTSCYKSTWTIHWTTFNPTTGLLVPHHYDIPITNAVTLSWYINAVQAYITGNNLQNATVSEKWESCSVQCCVNQYSFCYDDYDNVVQTLIYQLPTHTGEECDYDQYCYINPCTVE